jgi:signal transduction histidine kinase
VTTTPAIPVQTLTPTDLAELMSAFNEVTGRLQQTHESLQREVVRLQAELRDANEQLQRSRRLAALGEMAAGIAHEVRNPLGSIGLYARMLEQDLADRPGERATAAKIAAAVRGLDAIVGDVLTFARELTPDPEPLSALDVLTRAAELALADRPAGAPRIRLSLPASDAELWADAVQAPQALLNIVRNAVQSMDETPHPPGGHALTLSIAAAESGDVILAIADTGPGVRQDVVDRMFNPFFTTRRTGTGLGLAIVHRIIDAHGGQVRVVNNAMRRPGEPGATFELVFPRCPHERAQRCTVTVTAGMDARSVEQSPQEAA